MKSKLVIVITIFILVACKGEVLLRLLKLFLVVLWYTSHMLIPQTYILHSEICTRWI